VAAAIVVSRNRGAATKYANHPADHSMPDLMHSGVSKVFDHGQETVAYLVVRTIVRAVKRAFYEIVIASEVWSRIYILSIGYDL
jgi:hypothetical protein